MFAPSIHVECIGFFEPSEGEWREEYVKAPTQDEMSGQGGDDEEDFLSFCRRSVL